MPQPFLIELGSRVREIISGLEGIVVARSQYLTGCNGYGIQPGLDKDGKVPDATWFDENRLQVMELPRKEALEHISGAKRYDSVQARVDHAGGASRPEPEMARPGGPQNNPRTR